MAASSDGTTVTTAQDKDGNTFAVRAVEGDSYALAYPVSDNGDGTRSVSAAISDEEFAEIYQDFIDDMSASAGQEGAVSDLSVSNGKVDITVDENGYVSVYKVSFEMNLKVESSGVSMDAKAPVEMAITFHNPGTAVTVTPPDGYQDFPEVSSSLLG